MGRRDGETPPPRDMKFAVLIAVALEAASYQLTLANGFRAQGTFDIVFNLFVFFWIGRGAIGIYRRLSQRLRTQPDPKTRAKIPK